MVVIGVDFGSGLSVFCETNSHVPEGEALSLLMSPGRGIDGVVRLRNLFTIVRGFIEPKEKELR